MTSNAVKRILSAGTICAAAAFFLAAAPAAAQTTPAADDAKQTVKPLVIGHRGAAGLVPENTLAAFAKACELGADMLELDVLVSADGKLVVHHDFKLKPETTRTPDGKWLGSDSRTPIKDLPFAQLKTYDIGRLKPGSEYAGRYPEQAPADGERIPALKEVIQLMKARCGPNARLLIEVKTSPEEADMTPAPEAVADQVVALVRAEDFAARAIIQSFDWRVMARVKKAAPEIALAHLTVAGGLNTLKAGKPGPSPWLAGIDVDDFNGSVPQAVKAAGGTAWAPHLRDLTRDALAEAHRLGLAVYVWTVDKPEDMQRMIEMQVDGVITNRPDILKKLLTAN
jgi:glycerophosphoryl diester phosphodiesterase